MLLETIFYCKLLGFTERDVSGPQVSDFYMIGLNLGLLGMGKGFEGFVFGFEVLHKVFEGFLLGKSGFF